MMKKLNFVLGALVLAAALSACGDNSSGDEVKRIDKSAESSLPSGQTSGQGSDAQASGNGNTADNDANTSSAQTAGFIFEAEVSGQKVAVSVDEFMAPVLSVLGDPAQYFEAASCAFEGLDKMYTYAHFEIDTYPSADGDRISAIYLTDDLVSTKEGLSIGSSKEEMEKLYGTDYEVSGTEYTYQKGDMSLKILIDGGKVYYITYASKVLGTVAGN